jgi:hypothetical protein
MYCAELCATPEVRRTVFLDAQQLGQGHAAELGGGAV